MREKNNKGAMDNNRVMKKVIPLMFLFVLMIAPVNAIIGINEFPVTEANIEYVETIDQSGYGFEGANVTCSAFNFDIPSRQASNPTYISIGYTPLCDVNYTDYEQYITLFCRGEYLWTSNYTEQCGLPAEESVFGDDLYVQINHANFSSFTTGSGKLVSCQMCVNSSSTAPRTDFFVNINNVGTRVDSKIETIQELSGLDTIKNAIIGFIEFVATLVALITAFFSATSVIWVGFAVIMFTIFLFIRFRKAVYKMLEGK